MTWQPVGGDYYMKKPYSEPTVESEAVFEVLAAGCTLLDPALDTRCDSDFGGQINQTLGGS
jgi:hypothetical protein